MVTLVGPRPTVFFLAIIAMRHTIHEMGVNLGYRQQAAGEDRATPGC